MNTRDTRRISQLPLLGALFALGACSGSSSGSSSAPAPSAVNLGLPFVSVTGAGESWVVSVPEAGHARDLDADGDLADTVLHWVDLAGGTVRNTGLVVGTSVLRTDVVPVPLLALGPAFAVGASEFEMGGRDRNGDGDGFDSVLAVIDPDDGSVRNVGLAVSRLAFAGDVVAFDVPELGQGMQDLDGDGAVTVAVVPHFHDLATGETWSSNLRGARVLSGTDGFVALAESEAVVGDENGDGDALDDVLAVYDVGTRTVASAGLALFRFLGMLSPPFPHDGRFGVRVDEVGQGLGDLNGDGVVLGAAAFVFDPVAASARGLPGFELFPVRGVEPFVLTELQLGSFEAWTYDADADALAPTGWSSAVLQSLGHELVLLAIESEEGQDLDGDGALDDTVPVVFDPATRASRVTGVAGTPQSEGGLLLVLVDETLADLNADGDLGDDVLHVWDDAAGVMVNTRQATRDAAAFGGSSVLFLRSEAEAGEDLDADGDLEDRVAHVLDVPSGAARNLGLASELLLGNASTAPRGFLPVSETKAGADLNGDGDEADDVLHLVETP